MKNWCSGKVDSDLNSTSQIHNRCQFSIKYFSLCETSGYLWNSYVYLSKVNDSPGDAAYMEDLGKSGAVVPKLMSELYNKGYHVYMDNWYTSLKLFQHLESNGTAACGTAWKDRIMPLRSLHNESLKRVECFQKKWLMWWCCGIEIKRRCISYQQYTRWNLPEQERKTSKEKTLSNPYWLITTIVL